MPRASRSARDGARRLALGRHGGRSRAAIPTRRGTCFGAPRTCLPRADPQRLALLPELGEVLMEMGDFAGARTVVDEAVAGAESQSLPLAGASGKLVRLYLGLVTGEPAYRGDEVVRVTRALIPLLESSEALDELATAWRLLGVVDGVAGHYGAASEHFVRSIDYARRAGNERIVTNSGLVLVSIAVLGPTPVEAAIAHCESLVAQGLRDRQAQGKALCTLAQLRAMRGQIDAARALYRQGRAMLNDLGRGVVAASTAIDLASLEFLGGDLAAAEREVREDYDFLSAAGETYYLSTVAAMLARLVRDQERCDEALSLTEIAEKVTAPDDIHSQSIWRAVRAPIIARRGDLAPAEQLARAAVDLAKTTEAPGIQADALAELAVVLDLAGRHDDARTVRQEALALYEGKGNVVAAAGCRALLDKTVEAPRRA